MVVSSSYCNADNIVLIRCCVMVQPIWVKDDFIKLDFLVRKLFDCKYFVIHFVYFCSSLPKQHFELDHYYNPGFGFHWKAFFAYYHIRYTIPPSCLGSSMWPNRKHRAALLPRVHDWCVCEGEHCFSLPLNEMLCVLVSWVGLVSVAFIFWEKGWRSVIPILDFHNEIACSVEVPLLEEITAALAKNFLFVCFLIENVWLLP